MKNCLQVRALALAAALSFVGLTSVHALTSNNIPVLAITPDDSVPGAWNVTVTNPVPGHAYRIEKRTSLNDPAGWQFHLQTASNFSITPLANSSQFFRALLLTQALPNIVSFNVNPATIPSNGSATLNWSVDGASHITIDHGVGNVSATNSLPQSITGTRTYSLVATNDSGSVTGLATVVVGQLPSQVNGWYTAMISPTSGQHFLAPGMVRVFAAGYDPTVDTNFPRDGKGGNASRVEFLLDNQVVQTMDGADAEYWVFRATLTNVPTGTHVLKTRAFYTAQSPTLILDSDPVTFTVDPTPAYGVVTNLTHDVVLSGAQSFQLIGTPSARVRVNGNGFHIRTSGTWTGQFTLQFADLSGLSLFNDSTPGIDVTTTKALTMENCIFDSCGTIALTFNGTNTASVSSNEFRSNMTMPLSQYPDDFGDPQSSFPAVRFAGSSTGQKVFRANNMGAGWLRLTGVNNWTIGGDSDAQENVFIGPRVGIMLESGANHITVRRNYSHHVYYGGWSQGNNFELGESNDHVIVEHNIVRDSSWAVRGVACEFRYNLVMGAGHEWMWITADNAYVHHNIFAGGSADVTGIWMIYGPQNVRFWNNTVDGTGETAGPSVLLVDTAATADVESCVFMRNDAPSAVEVDGTLTAVGNNAFYNPQAGGIKNYSDNRHPATDIGALNAQVNPGLTNAVTSVGIDDSAMWQRTTSVRQVLQRYRTRYTPNVGSPLIDAVMLDFDNIEDWSSRFSSAMESHVSNAIVQQLIASSPKYFENALDFIFSLVDRDTIIDVALELICSEQVLAYHGSRLNDEEVASIRAKGLIPLKAEERRHRLTRALSTHPRWPEVGNRLDSVVRSYKNDQGNGNREGQVHLVISRAALISSFNHYLICGSEFDQCVAHKLLGEEGLTLLEHDGKPNIIKVAVPGESALTAAHPYFDIEHTRARGDLPNIVGEFLRAWSFRLAKPEFQSRDLHDGAGMVFNSVVPADWILDIEEL